MVVPAHNEGRIIRANVKRLSLFLRAHLGNSFELIVVDNGSTDSTFREARRAAVADPRIRVIRLAKKGLGRALHAGFAFSRGDWIFWYPADLAADLSFITRARKHFHSADAILGSRRLVESTVDSKPVRRVLSFVFNKLANSLLSLRVSDSQCVKAFRRSRLEPVLPHARENGILFELELLALLKRRGARMMELPVHVVDHRPDSKIAVHSSGHIFLELLALRRRLARKQSPTISRRG